MSRSAGAMLPPLLAGILLCCGCGRPPAAPIETAAEPTVGEAVAGQVEVVALPGGTFEMGSDDPDESDQSLHKVRLSPFVIDKYLVTQEQYENLMGTNPSHWEGPKNPVDKIRWLDAAAYCNKRSIREGFAPCYDLKTLKCDFTADGYRLPTEAEYEYALRAGTATLYFFADSPSDLKRYAWFKENSPRGSHPIGEKLPNAWGLHDMVGNVWEWCNDYYREDYYRRSPAEDPCGPSSGENRVVRGGCWNSKPGDCRSAYRNFEMPAFTDICFAKDIHGQIGFRCVRRQSGK
jgi:formylglycine-generating enzyme required for sulfatase activity